MSALENGLCDAQQYEAALSVQEAELAMMRRLGAAEHNILVVQANLAITYGELGQIEKALSMERDIYSGRLKLSGEEHKSTIIAASNYANSLIQLKRFEEAKSLLRKAMPVARRVLGENHEDTLLIRVNYAKALYKDDGATLDDLRDAVTTLEETERIARRVFGGSHPMTVDIEHALPEARAALAAREGDDASAVRGALGAMRAT